MRKIIAVFLLIALILGLGGCSSEEAREITQESKLSKSENNPTEPEAIEEIYVREITENDEYKYAVYSNNTVEILKYLKNPETFVDLIIPDTIDGYKVTSIGEYAFDIDWYVSGKPEWKITIPNGITHIGKGAFASFKYLTSLTIPDSVTYIGDSAFDNGKEWLHNTDLTNVTIPDNVTYIGNWAFRGNLNLTITCSKGSAAHKYCEKEKVMFKLN